VIVPLLLQLAVATPVSAGDSSALLDRLRGAHFNFMLDWQRQHWWDGIYRASQDAGGPTIRHFDAMSVAGILPQGSAPSTPRTPAPPSLKTPIGGCQGNHAYNSEVDQRLMAAHLIKNWSRLYLYACPRLTRGAVTVRQQGVIDYVLSREARDTVRSHRADFLRVLDSAARRLPGDRWILGQRVRLLIDHGDAQAALRLTDVCGGEAWWCAALRGYVLGTVGDQAAAYRALVAAHEQMPTRARLEWDDIYPLLTYTGRRAIDDLPEKVRDSLNTIAWWLADPLFIEDGNDRLAEHMWRRVNAELRNGGMDVGADWREHYHGAVAPEMVVRYGWLGPANPCGRNPRDGTPVPNTTRNMWPPRWGHPSLSVMNRIDGWFQEGQYQGCSLLQTYPGPMFHTFPAWNAIANPFEAKAADWDLAPPRDVGEYWDASWWAAELYQRKNGPIVPVEHQVAMLRRQDAPLLAAAMSWDTAGYTFPPPPRVVAAAITMTGPRADRLGLRDTMKSAALRAMLVPMLPGRTLLSLEMVPQGVGLTAVPGTAGRARLGINAPPALAQLGLGEIAISDPILVRVADDQTEPRSLPEVLARMYGTTTLRNPTRVGVFWETYGFADGDTASVTVTIVRQHDEVGALRRIGAAAGIGEIRNDSLTYRWTEPRRGDPDAVREPGVPVRPRGLVLSTSALPTGRYTLHVSMSRAGATASARRDLVITR
jgi:hypothetical protein